MRALSQACGIAVIVAAMNMLPQISQFTIYQRNNHAIFWAVVGVAAVLFAGIVVGGSLMLRHRH